MLAWASLSEAFIWAQFSKSPNQAISTTGRRRGGHTEPRAAAAARGRHVAERIWDVDLWLLPLLRPPLQLFAVAATGRVRIFFRSVLLAQEVFVQMTGSLVRLLFFSLCHREADNRVWLSFSSMAFLLLYLPVVVDDESTTLAWSPWRHGPW